jgi:hypothetical protein
MAKDILFESRDKVKIWQKYCGFLDFTLSEFMDTQKQLLMEEIELIHGSPIAIRFMPKRPTTVTEFRDMVSMTTYKDYADYFSKKDESVLTYKPFCWARTSGRGGQSKWIPYSDRAAERLTIFTIAMMILAAANHKGEVNIDTGIRILHNVPPSPYMSGILIGIVADLLNAVVIPPLDNYEETAFDKRIQDGFQIALRSGADILSSLTTVLIKIGEGFAENSGRMKLNRRMLHPQVMIRLIRALLISRKDRRGILPKDLWPLKGLCCYGTDTAIYRDQLIYYWGKTPLEIYAATESGVIAANAWNKKYMTFTPLSCFLEFAPESEWLKSREDENYQPSTVLMDEVEPGKKYEVIITSFYGMPLLRYRLGDLIKVVSLKDTEAGIKIPQMVFVSRTDGIIDIAGFTRLDEKTIWQTLANTKIKHEDWCVRKEYDCDRSILHLYIELKEHLEADDIEKRVHEELSKIDADYRDLENMLGIRPLQVTILPQGSFASYYEARKKEGADLAHLKPPHMNPSDAIVHDLLGVSPRD